MKFFCRKWHFHLSVTCKNHCHMLYYCDSERWKLYTVCTTLHKYFSM